ncbi:MULTISPECIES: RDD family protein [unclassified Streptomyces]|uniref:RDD family protein n=1 Tax=unclassified Streptomyces TaxID=2593676 RepID=UPI003321773E
MSAPTPAPGDDRPREGYYPDPSIPGYVRYWNGAAWVPGTSRPAPTDGESLPAPPGAAPASASAAEETGPHFFDEEPMPSSSMSAPEAAAGADDLGASQHGSRPEPASAWQADAARQTGLGGEQERRISWGGPEQRNASGVRDPRDPRVPVPSESAAESASPSAPSASASPSASAPAPAEASSPPETNGPGTVQIRAIKPGGAGNGTGKPAAGTPPKDQQPPAEGTVTFRRPAGPVRPTAAAPATEGTMAIRALRPKSSAAGTAARTPAPPQAAVPPQAAAHAPAPAPAAAPAPAPAPAPAQPTVPQQGGAPGGAASPVTSGPGGGSPSWAQQVHQLAEGDGQQQPVVPWKPVASDPFLAMAQNQAAGRPAGLGRRFAARLIDTVVLVAVTGAAALPLGTKAADHVDSKIDAAKMSGEKVTVWLLDGTTAGYLGMVLAVLLLFGVLYEVLPTAKWGRTLGKKVLGLQVRDMEEHEAPTFGVALKRWLVYVVPGVLVIGVVGVLWCVFDRPWRQCWHDKAAGTFVAG